MNLRLHHLLVAGDDINIDEHFLATFGRSPNAHIVIDHPSVVGMLGEFFVLRGELHLRDLVCDGCTLVNGSPIDSEVVLEEGDVISCGETPLFVLKRHRSLSIPRASKKVTQLERGGPGAVRLVGEGDQGTLVGAPVAGAEKAKVGGVKLWLAVLLTVGLVAVALLQPKSSSTESQQQEWSRGDYLKELNLAVAEFRSQAYGDVVHSMKALIRHYPQNHAAHILGDLAKIWNEKGQRYEGLDWKRAEDLSRELINVYPSTELVKGLGQDLSDWLSKEEPNMEAIQKALVLMEQSSWRSAVEAFGAVSEDSRFCELYAESRQEARSGWIGEIEEQLEDRVARQRWGDALEKLGLLLAIEKRAVWLEQRERYRQYFRTGKMLREAEDAHQRGDYDFVEQVLQVYPHDGPQGKRVQTLLQSAMVAKQRRERDDYFVQGRAAQAIEVSKQHFPEDLLYVQHVQRVLALYEGAQAAVLSEQPELVVPLCEKIMALESDETNHYVVQARRWRNKWSSSRQLADLFLNRANAAWENRDLAEALKWYQAAEAKGSLGAVDQLKSMEKQASLHYNRAMLFANQGDKPSVSLYLRKALALLPEGHRLRDRIELYVRRQMK